jgi:hypothetical protein
MIPHIPAVPPSIVCDANHAEIIVICLLILIGLLVWLYRAERNKNTNEEREWKLRLEVKLDKALDEHRLCRESLPFTYATKTETFDMQQAFKDLTKERTEAWEKFTNKFEDFVTQFWNHAHDTNGKVERK